MAIAPSLPCQVIALSLVPAERGVRRSGLLSGFERFLNTKADELDFLGQIQILSRKIVPLSRLRVSMSQQKRQPNMIHARSSHECGSSRSKNMAVELFSKRRHEMLLFWRDWWGRCLKVRLQGQHQMLHRVFGEWGLLMIELAEQCAVKSLFEREPKFVGVGVQIRPSALIHDGDTPILAPFATDLKCLAIHSFPGGIYQFRDTEHPPQ